MQWRRGFAFAAIHLAVALPIMVSLEAGDTAMWSRHSSSTAPALEPQIVPTAAIQESGDAVLDFNICNLGGEPSPRERIIDIADLPAAVLTGWRMPCPPRWTISGMLIGTTWERPTPTVLAKRRTVDRILLVLIAAQWLLIGGFPLRPQEKLRRDPAALITLCTVAACASSFVPEIDFLSGLFMLIAAVTWLFWLSMLFWKLFRSVRNWIAIARTRTRGTA
jgi:hypothetical protein